MPQPLPIAACSLDSSQAAEQGRRYAELGAGIESIERRPAALAVRLGAGVDESLVEETIAVERGCCSFFEIEWTPAKRLLGFKVAEPAHAPALDAIAEAIAAGSR